MSNIDKLYEYIQAKRNNGYTYLGYATYNVSKSDLKKLKDIADSYGFPFEWLANLINFESGGTWNPAITNSLGYVGLIQFGQSAAQEIGTTREALKAMTFSQQLDYVSKYLNESFDNRNVFASGSKKVNSNFTQQDLFMTIFYPKAVGNPNYQFPQNVVAANNGIKTPTDYTNRVLSKTTVPFKTTEVASDLRGYTASMGGIFSGFATHKAEWWFIPATILIFGTITTLAIYYYKKNKR